LPLSQPRRVLVVGATGRVGGEVIRLLATEGVATRALVRSAAAAQSMPAGVEAVPGDLGDEQAVDTAIRGVTQVFVAIRDCAEQVALEGRLIDAAVRHGVARFVKVSAFAAGLSPPPGYGRIHAEIEAHLRQSGLDWTILRPYMYMQNLLDLAGPIRAVGLLPFPMGRGRIALIDARDVARAGTVALGSAECPGQFCELTGPESLDLAACARIIGDVTGRRSRYLPVPQLVAGALMRLQGVSAWDVKMRAELFAMLRADGESRPNDAFLQLTGRPPLGLREFIEDHSEILA
jgi:uncharacterized protein YbjT (DUF2867 family)